MGPSGVAVEAARVFSVGLNTAPAQWFWTTCFVLLCLAGVLYRPLCRRHFDGRLHAAAFVLVPVLLMVMLATVGSYFRPRFLLVALPGFHLLVGHGASAIGDHLRYPRLVSLAAVAWLVLAARSPLLREWFDQRVWRDDYRGIARTIAATASPKDAILLIAPGQIEIFDYYYRGALPRYPLPRRRPTDVEATLAELEPITQRHRRLYTVL